MTQEKVEVPIGTAELALDVIQRERDELLEDAEEAREKGNERAADRYDTFAHLASSHVRSLEKAVDRGNGDK